MFREIFLSLFVLFSLARGDNAVKAPIRQGTKPVHVRRFAKIPDHNGQPSRIQSITSKGNSLYVCTGTSGGLIYKVSMTGQVSMFFNVDAGLREAKGRQMDYSSAHGGLRSVAFHPRFNKNGFLYTSLMETRNGPASSYKYFSRPSNMIGADSVVIEWKYSFKEKKVLPSSYRQVIRIGMPVFDHPVKQMAFRGPFLYIAHGDGSVQSAITGGGQKNDGLGKILRINPLRAKGKPYSIPPNNPFKGKSKYKDELFAVGFRNPHNICFSKGGQLFVTDAGRDNVEEVNIVRAGGNYGWSKREGPFVHKASGGLVNGVGPLPKDDAKYGFIYPNVIVGHEGSRGAGFVGQALAGSCPVENGSPMSGTFIYANFPTDGNLYYSFLSDMRKAKTTGPPNKLTQAPTFKAKIHFDHDNNPKTGAVVLNNLRDVIRREPGFGSADRADIRFGRGPSGEIYFSSKTVGRVYLITSTKGKGKR